MSARDRAARIVETHISCLFLVGDRAYKLKKPVRYAFIDQSTREIREAACHREVELNRRLAPDVYLGVLDVCDASGRPVDHLVEMQRLPDERRLAFLVSQGHDVGPCLHQLARDLAAFHAAAPTSAEICAHASRDSARQRWHDNFNELKRFVGSVVDPVAHERMGHLVERYLEGRGPLFASRATERHARDGHGDLLAEDVFCLDDGPRALDCIEFDDHLRWGDVLADVAFLAMDLERLGSRADADRFLAWYRGFSGESYPASLADFYVAYRACIRAKVACLKHEQGDEPALQRARSLLDLCERRLDRGRVRLVLVGGLPGTGKSTLASTLSARTGWSMLRSDEVRKDVTGTPHVDHHKHRFGSDIYSDAQTERTYKELLERARRLLGYGESVILDASWIREEHRRWAATLARETSSDVLPIRCVLDARIAAERMHRRRAEGTDPSDADARVAAAMAVRFEPWPDAREVSTARSTEDVAQAVCDAFGLDR
jgi:uncharacterized protein